MAQPCISYPTLFARNTIFDKFPFLLPNLVCGVILTVGVMIGILFLEETHEEIKGRRDIGLEAGKWIISCFVKVQVQDRMLDKDGNGDMDDSQPLLEDESPPGYRTTEGSSRAESPATRKTARPKQIGMQRAFTKQVVLNIIGYGILA